MLCYSKQRVSEQLSYAMHQADVNTGSRMVSLVLQLLSLTEVPFSVSHRAHLYEMRRQIAYKASMTRLW